MPEDISLKILVSKQKLVSMLICMVKSCQEAWHWENEVSNCTYFLAVLTLEIKYISYKSKSSKKEEDSSYFVGWGLGVTSNAILLDN